MLLIFGRDSGYVILDVKLIKGRLRSSQVEQKKCF